MQFLHWPLQFESQLWSSLMSLLGSKHSRSTAYHPQTNGTVERLHRQLKAALRAQTNPDTWMDTLPLASGQLSKRISKRQQRRWYMAQLFVFLGNSLPPVRWNHCLSQLIMFPNSRGIWRDFVLHLLAHHMAPYKTVEAQRVLLLLLMSLFGKTQFGNPFNVHMTDRSQSSTVQTSILP